MKTTEKIHKLCELICNSTDNVEIKAYANQIDWYVESIKTNGDINHVDITCGCIDEPIHTIE